MKTVNKIRIIDLLNKIANRAEVPEKIKYDTKNYYFRNYDYKECFLDADYNYIDEQTSFMDCIDFYKLNDEIEIIEEDKQIEKIKINYAGDIEEKIFYEESDKPNHCIMGDAGTELLINKINEIIDEVNKLKKESDK